MENIEPKLLLKARNAYNYPAYGLTGSWLNCSDELFHSVTVMESHFKALLESKTSDEVLLGYSSVIFWGHVSGSDGRVRIARALARVKQARDGYVRNGRRTQHVNANEATKNGVVAQVRQAKMQIDCGEYGNAALGLANHPGLGFAFATKICAFLNPEKCGVADSIIANGYPELGFSTLGGYISKNRRNADQYALYCGLLTSTAQRMNYESKELQWGSPIGNPWRAVDTERALYHLLQVINL